MEECNIMNNSAVIQEFHGFKPMKRGYMDKAM